MTKWITFKELSGRIGVSQQNLYKWVRDRHVKSKQVGGKKCVSEAAINRLIKKWERTCTPTNAARWAGCNPNLIWYFIRVGVAKGVKVNGHWRVWRSSIQAISDHVMVSGLTRARVVSLRRGKTFQRLAKPLPKIKEKEISVIMAADLLGVNKDTVRNWMSTGRLEQGRPGKFLRVTVSSIRALRIRLKAEFGQFLKK
jgi:hypothetical protein